MSYIKDPRNIILPAWRKVFSVRDRKIINEKENHRKVVIKLKCKGNVI